MLMTGLLIKRLVKERGYCVSEIQKRLGLSCPQPIYRWYSGINLPSVDNLFILSRMLGLHMEDLLIQRDDSIHFIKAFENKYRNERMAEYVGRVWEGGRLTPQSSP